MTTKLNCRKNNNIAQKVLLLSALTRSSHGETKNFEVLTKSRITDHFLLREVIEAIDGGVALLDVTGRVLAANGQFRELWGIPTSYCPTVDPDSFLKIPMSQVMDSTKVFSLPSETYRDSVPNLNDSIELLDGRTFTRQLRPFDLNGSRQGFLLTFRDISAQRETERELQRKTAFLEALSESTMEGILVVDGAGKKLLTNQQLVKTWQLPQHIIDDPNDLAQLNFVVGLTKHPEQFLEKVKYLYAHPEEHSRDNIEFANGTTLDRYSAPVVGKDGTHYGRIWSFRDVTELVNARKAAEAASLAKGQFLANISHEIRTPLNGIIGLTSILLEGNLDADSRDVVSTIQSSGATLLRIINDVLDLSKIEAGAFEMERKATNLEELCHDIISLYKGNALERGIYLRAASSGERSREAENVLIDPVRIRQVLSNLVSNAVKFTHTGGVTLDWSVELSGSQAVVRFWVSDTGIGIGPDRLDAIFDSFTQATTGIHSVYGGTGLGLAISKKLIELMGGTTGVTSSEGKGSTFWVELPAVVTESAEDVLGDLGETPDGTFKGYHILLAEDNAVNVKVVRRMLNRTGCTVDVADNGMTALSKIHTNHYDLVLMDVMMPVCDGLEATRQIRSFEKSRGCSRLPIVALTANGLSGDRELCLDAGMDDYLTKPFTAVHLRSILYKWLPINGPVDCAA